MMKDVVELLNIEIFRCCKLNLKTGEMLFCDGSKKVKGFTGLYFMDADNFFAIYPSSEGPIMYYKKKKYALHKDLHISLTKMGEWREFHILEYDIYIRYQTSKYIGFDVWSDEIDVDLFYQIEQSYKKDEYYRKFTNPNL